MIKVDVGMVKGEFRVEKVTEVPERRGEGDERRRRTEG